MFGIAARKLRLIPAHGGFIEAAVHRNIGQRLAVVAFLGRIAQKALQFALRALLIAGAAADNVGARAG